MSSRSLKEVGFILLRLRVYFPEISQEAQLEPWENDSHAPHFVSTLDMIGYPHAERAACHHGD